MPSPPAPPLISVALCTYNGERYLAEQLASVLRQDWPNLEIVVVDDGSSDGTWSQVQDIARADARVRPYRNERNLGIVANFSRALSLCRGDLIAPCDQDDIWHPQKLSKLFDALGSRALSYCDSELIDSDGLPMQMRVSDRLNMYQGNDSLALTFWNCVSGHAMLFRHELLAAAQPMPQQRFHDWWLAFAAASTGGIAYLDEPLVQYRQHAEAQTDIARTALKRKKKRGSVAQIFEERGQWLRRLAALPGPNQPYLIELDRLWTARAQQWFSPGLIRHLAARSEALMFTNKKESFTRFAMKQFWGLKTKLLFSRTENV